GGPGANAVGGGVALGGTANGARNVTAATAGNGVLVNGARADGTLIQGNYIGTNGSLRVPNRVDGVQVVNASNVTIGGPAEGAGNVISGNGRFGIQVVRAGAVPLTGTVIQGNWICPDASGHAPP